MPESSNHGVEKLLHAESEGPVVCDEQKMLRHTAEALLAQRSPGSVEGADEDFATLLHELQVHQIELELQNEELRRAQLELQASHRRYLQLYHHAPVGYLVLDRNGIIRQANLTFADMVGKESSELLNTPFTRYLLPDEQPVFLARLRGFFSQPEHKIVETKLAGSKGMEPRIVHLTAIKNSNLEISREDQEELFLSVADITTRANAELEVRKSRDFFLAVIDTLPLGLAVVDVSGRIVASNNRWISDFSQSLGGEQFSSAISNYYEMCRRLPTSESNRLQIADAARRVLLGESVLESLELNLEHHRWLWVSITLARVEPDEQNRTVVIHQDISEQKQREENDRALLKKEAQVEKLNSLSCMTGAIVHHFNNLMAIIQPNLELLEDYLPFGEPRTILEDVAVAANRATALTRNLLSFVEEPLGRQAKSDLGAVLRERMVRFNSEIDNLPVLLLDCPDQGPLVKTSHEELAKVVDNLIVNAWESMAGKGTIRIQVKKVENHRLPEGSIFPPDWHPKETIYSCFSVMDTGSGIAESDYGRLFDPFFSTKFTGRGLGLSIVLGLVRSCGGAIAVAPRMGTSGSIFTVFLPCIE